MTKKQWQNSKPGDKVWTKSEQLNIVDGKCITKTNIITGIIKRFNSNASQALVDWGDFERWYGRLGIEHFDNINDEMSKYENPILHR